VAQGERLPFGQEDVRVSGHAIEVRVYAEDPYAGFLPQAGTAQAVAWPQHARVDAGLEPGQTVSTYYDPMLGKIITDGADRESARRALVAALDNSGILGLTSNLGYLRDLAASPEFAGADIDTSWLDTHPDRFSRSAPEAAWCLAAWSVARPERPGSPGGPFDVPDGWRLSGPSAAVPVQLADRSASTDSRLLYVDVAGGSVESFPDRLSVREVSDAEGWLRLEIDGEVHAGLVRSGDSDVEVAYRGQTHAFERPDAFGADSRTSGSDGVVVAPMPGTVLSVDVTVGDSVDAGAGLGVLEAMKMELALKAPVAGRVAEVNAAVGGSVELGKRLFVIEAEPS
jgi:acetyl-CoA/propionyl-CoA carboxylase, biotin carboxylase, biotin carboxyl carrier protein